MGHLLAINISNPDPEEGITEAKVQGWIDKALEKK